MGEHHARLLRRVAAAAFSGSVTGGSGPIEGLSGAEAVRPYSLTLSRTQPGCSLDGRAEGGILFPSRTENPFRTHTA